MSASCVSVRPTTASDIRRVLVDNGTHEWDGRPNGRAGRMLAAEQHVEKDAQRIHIRGRGDRPAGELLWRGILGRQCRTGVTRERARSGRRITPRGVALEQLGDAEVEQFHLTIHADDDVRGLDVTVHDQVGVGMRDRLQDVEKQAQAALDPERVLAACRSMRWPSTCSRTRYGWPAGDTPASMRCAMCGWVRRAKLCPRAGIALHRHDQPVRCSVV